MFANYILIRVRTTVNVSLILFHLKINKRNTATFFLFRRFLYLNLNPPQITFTMRKHAETFTYTENKIITVNTCIYVWRRLNMLLYNVQDWSVQFYVRVGILLSFMWGLAFYSVLCEGWHFTQFYVRVGILLSFMWGLIFY